MDAIVITRRLTTSFIKAVPPQVELFDAYIYAIVGRKPHKIIDHKYGREVRIDPCELNWQRKTIKINIPADINPGITSIDDLEDDWYEAVLAAFLTLIQGCLP